MSYRNSRLKGSCENRTCYLQDAHASQRCRCGKMAPSALSKRILKSSFARSAEASSPQKSVKPHNRKINLWALLELKQHLGFEKRSNGRFRIISAPLGSYTCAEISTHRRFCLLTQKEKRPPCTGMLRLSSPAH